MPVRLSETERGKLIMLVSEFYYGKCEGDQSAAREQKSNTTFKCNSCLKILKNNIRYVFLCREVAIMMKSSIVIASVSLSGVQLEHVYGRKLHYENTNKLCGTHWERKEKI